MTCGAHPCPFPALGGPHGEPLCKSHASIAAVRTRCATGTPAARREYPLAVARWTRAGVWVPDGDPWDAPTPGAVEGVRSVRIRGEAEKARARERRR